MLNPIEIEKAYKRISPYIIKTPILESEFLNNISGSRILFKFEGLQRTGAFKVRGALNTIISLKELNNLPEHVTAFSSGNHAQAVAYAAKLFGIKATIFIPEFCSKYKIEATRSYGAEVILTKSRAEAEEKVKGLQEQGAYLIAPFDNDMVIAGQGTSCYEVLNDDIKPDAIFATCGGGGWTSGSYLAKELLSPSSKMFSCEPLMANDAAISYKTGKIFSYDIAPETIADGARTPKISDRTFEYIKKFDGFFEIPEEEILHWTRELFLNLKVTVEPTSAVAMAGAYRWIEENNLKDKIILVLLSGGNIDADTYKKIWE